MSNPHELAQKIFSDLNLSKLSQQQQEQILNQLIEHFSSVMRDVGVALMNDEQFERYLKAMSSDNPDMEVARIASEVPALSEAIEHALEEEYETMKAVMAA